MVSDKLQSIQQPKGDLWTTGQVLSSQHILVEYKGKALRPFTRYYWRVRVYDQNGEASSWSKPAWFETAMLKETDWQAHWIGDGRKQFETPEAFYGDDPMPLFRKTFMAPKTIAAARLYIAASGIMKRI